jgi:prolyl-tRNA synthetase
MADMCSIDADESSLRESASSFERVAESFFKRLGLKYYRLEKNDGKYVDFVIPCEEGETYISIDGQDNARFSSEEERANAITASSVGMYFIFEHFNEQAITYLSRLGKREPVQLGTYGFGLQRCLHALVHQTRDALGIKFSDQVRPFDASIIPVNSLDPTQLKQADRVYQAMQSRLKKPLLDDRKDNIKTRAEYADFIGCPYKVFIGPSEMKEGVLNIKRRGELNSRIMKLEEFLNEI